MVDLPISYARNGDVSIAYTTFGDGPVELIFVGGFVSHLEIVFETQPARQFFERLGAFCRVIAFDKRGMGLSDRGSGSYTVEGVAEDMVAVLDAVGVERAAVFGVSEGGAAATMFTATYPERVTSMVQYGTYARMSEAPDHPEGVPMSTIRTTHDRLFEEWGNPESLKMFSRSWARDPELLEWWGRLLRAGASPAGVHSLIEMYEKLDVRPLLPLVKVPTLIIWRRDDKLVPPAMTKLVAQGIPGAKAVELPGEDHLFLAGDQEALLGEVEQFLTGERRPPPVERVLATVLFTDIVGSTQRAAELGDQAWRELLGQHDRIALREVERQRGVLVKSTGDGILASFDGPARAILAAQGMRDGLDELGLSIRAGVHTGECERMNGDLGGIAVHIGARVGSAAEPGEVLVSQTVRDLVVGSPLEFEDRGARELKGVPGEWRLFALRPEQAPVAAPSR
jgi:pimeloyl-ACP methyl ester carboxylesterase